MATTETPKAMLLRGMFPWLSEGTWMQMKAYAPTFLTEFTVMASQIVVYKLAAYFFTRDSFSEYAVARRTISLLYPPILLGLGVALPRYAGHANGVSNPQRSLRYYGAALR